MSANLIDLGPRLLTIASLIPKGCYLGDIGTDHAYLPVYLVQQGIISRAVGVDVHEGPYRSALETVRNYDLNSYIEVRKGDGLKPLRPREVNILAIAGMGGNTILEILAERQDVMEHIHELVLQPQGAEGKVCRELLKKGWKIKEELLVEEEGRIYVVIHFTRTEGLDEKDVEDASNSLLEKIKAFIDKSLFPVDVSSNLKKLKSEDAPIENTFIEEPMMKEIYKEENLKTIIDKLVWSFGAIITTQSNILLKCLMQDELERLHRVAEEMRRTAREEVESKAKQIRNEINVLEVIIRCLFQ